MHRVEFHKRALKALRRIPQGRVQQILEAIGEVADLPDPRTHQNVRPMQGEWQGSWRMRIGSYRAIFKPLNEEEEGDALLIRVTHIGPRGEIYG